MDIFVCGDPLHETAYRLEKALDTPAKIFYKNKM
jgi:predicted alternative tryptophan synthase beta-subunit